MQRSLKRVTRRGGEGKGIQKRKGPANGYGSTKDEKKGEDGQDK